MTRPTQLPAGERKSFTLFLFGTCVLTSASMFVTGRAPSNLESLLDDRFEWGWAALTFISSTMVIAGMFIRRTDISRVLELTGCVGMFFASGAYAAAIYYLAQSPTTSFAGPMFIAFAFACLGRVVEIIRRTQLDAKIIAKVKLIDAEQSAREDS